MGIPYHLTCLLRNLYVDQNATVRTLYGTTDWFKIEKGIQQGCILSPCLFNLHAEHIMWNARLYQLQTGIKIAGRNINNLRHADDTTLMTESKQELKNLLWGWKSWLKTPHSKNEDHSIWPHHFKANRRGKVEIVTGFIFLRSKITYSHKIKRRLLLGRRAMTNLDSVLKSRDITLPTKVHLVKSMVFPVVTYGCESWTIKKSECGRIDAFKLCC